MFRKSFSLLTLTKGNTEQELPTRFFFKGRITTNPRSISDHFRDSANWTDFHFLWNFSSDPILTVQHRTAAIIDRSSSTVNWMSVYQLFLRCNHNSEEKWNSFLVDRAQQDRRLRPWIENRWTKREEMHPRSLLSEKRSISHSKKLVTATSILIDFSVNRSWAISIISTSEARNILPLIDRFKWRTETPKVRWRE